METSVMKLRESDQRLVASNKLAARYINTPK
jgi:hypothetical protein